MNSTEFGRCLKNPGTLSQHTLTELENLVKDYPAFDTGWALWYRNLKNISSQDADQYLQEVAIRIHDRKWLKKLLETPAAGELPDMAASEYMRIADYSLESGYDSTEKPDSQKNKMSLIDNFLAGGGDFPRKTDSGEATQAADISEKAVMENDEIVTETFANILLVQGKHEKALKAFEKLSLKYPEKSIYFAARIEEVNSILKR
ncbi:MAG: hypothetical protein ACOZDD_14180 [Bacteroidota bacterium]